jgi:hypothetical protein
MTSLHRSQSAADRETERRASHDIALLTDSAGAPDGMSPGSLMPASFRVLRSHVGPSDAQIYAFRTDGDRVCGGILGETAGCFEGFAEDAGVNWTIGSRDDVTILFGFAPDRVASLRAVLDTGAGPEITIHDNTFYLEISGPSKLEAIDVFPPLDGEEERIDLSIS